MEGYVGVRFNASSISQTTPAGLKKYYPLFKSVCQILKENKMTYANAGNMSIAFKNGFIITSTGSNLGSLKKTELVYVEKCSLKKNVVCYYGDYKPSSETLMHYLIYSKIPGTQAIIHAHDEFATDPELLKGTVAESKKEAPYGSLELARLAIRTLKKSQNIIVLKNHGYVAVAKSLKSACGIILKTRNRLISKKTRRPV